MEQFTKEELTIISVILRNRSNEIRRNVYNLHPNDKKADLSYAQQLFQLGNKAERMYFELNNKIG